jgi:hypothetical protein
MSTPETVAEPPLDVPLAPPPPVHERYFHNRGYLVDIKVRVGAAAATAGWAAHARGGGGGRAGLARTNA